MPEGLFTTHGDEPVEARIVSWVLGEASAFEAAELERLCEERPELMVFKRRMLALHGLLAEAETARPDDEKWKLPPEKRKAVDEILGAESVVRLEMEKEKRIRHNGRRALLAIAACLILTVVVAGLTAPMVIRQRKKADMTEARSSERQRELADFEAKVSHDTLQSLRTEIPSELIEGTPKPMNVPNLEAPSDGPAGSATWRMAGRSRRGVETNEPTAKPESQSAPSASMEKVVAATTATATAVPVPDVNVTAPSLGFGAANDFGAGWGGGGGGGEGAELAAEQPASGLAGAEADPFAEKGLALADTPQRPIDAKSAPSAKVIREIEYPTEHEAPELPNSIVGFAGVSNGAAFPTTPATPTAFENAPTDASANSNEGALASSLAARERETKTGSATLSLKRGGVMPAEEPAESFTAGNRSGNITAGNRSGDFTIEKGNIDGILNGDVRSEGQKASNAEKQLELADTASVSEDVPVLGDLFSREQQSNLSFESDSSDYYDSSGSLSGANTYYGRTKVSSGKLGIDESGGFTGSDAQPPAAPMANMLNSSSETGEQAGENRNAPDGILPSSRVVTEEVRYKIDDSDRRPAPGESNIDWDTSKAVAKGKASGTEYVRNNESKNEYLFRGTALAKDKAMIPDDAEALAKAVRDQEDKVEERRKVLATIVRNKGIIYKGQDSFYRQSGVDEDESIKSEAREEAIQRGLDAQDYVDAKKEFEKDQELLQQMKLKLMADFIKAKPEPPKVDLTKLMEEIPAAEDPYSTFSLNISDASFQVAQAALAKGEQPDPAGIKVEQFYNAVDYGDPAPASNEPVAVNIEQSAHPVIPGRNLVRIALKTAAAGRSESQPLRLTLLVDQSGSMVREDRRAAMDKALAGLSELLTKNDLVTVIGFSRTPRLLADGMTGDKAGKLAELVNQSASEGGTNLEEAIKLGEQLADRRKLAGAQNRIVLFTDGAANLGNADPERLAEKVKQLRQKGIAFDIAGIAADGLNDELLGELARNGNGRYYVVGKGADGNFAKQLAGAFRPAAENVKVQVRFNPERVGHYKLIGFEKDRLKTEDFRNDKVDAAELAAEEAGVAIYQVEPLPEGNGELGEVSVRFRDTARGEMVERTWTIPHDSSAPVLDRATPSMQLAVLAMLSGEKLKGGPLADAIDFKQLIESTANVKQFYGNTGRIGDMLRVVDALK